MQTISNLFYEGSIFHALDEKRIQQETQENKDLTLVSKISIGVISGARKRLKALFVWTAIHIFVAKVFERILKASLQMGCRLSTGLVSVAIIAPLAEEIIFRLIFQNAILLIQKVLTLLTPTSWQENRLFEILTSTSFRIVTAGTLFGLAHLSNLTPAAPAFVIAQVAFIILFPVQSILYETTGSIIPPLLSHATFNGISEILGALV